MERLNIREVTGFVNGRIVDFHLKKLELLKGINLRTVLRKKNPYLFRAKNITVASDLVTEILSAFLYSSEEKVFGDFLEELARFIAGKTCGARKSAATGIDMEFMDEQVHYIVSIKSGPNWGNSSQQKKQESDFKTALKVLKQNNPNANIQPILGICYGRTKTSHLRGYRKVVGQSFWYMISENPDLYTDIIEPLGHKAREHNDKFNRERARVINLFTREFMSEFCTDGDIDWAKLVRFNSGNLISEQ